MKKRITLSIILSIALLLGLLIIYIGNGMIQNRNLILAIEEDNYVEAEKAIEKGAFVNCKKYPFPISIISEANQTPLTIACKSSNEKFIKLLVENGAKVNKDSIAGFSPLIVLLQSDEHNRFAVARYLIDNGADINATTNNKISVLKSCLEVSPNDDEETMQEGIQFFEYLLESSVNQNTLSPHNLLTYAAQCNNEKAVKYILDKGIDSVNSCDESGYTALMRASYMGHDGIVKLLLNNGADKSIKTGEGKTALDLAKEYKQEKIVKLLE